MTIWRTRPVTEEPEIKLSQWQIYEVDNGRHFVGYNDSWREGRVSSTIVEFDSETKRGITRSGRVYQLVGRSGYNTDANYVWNRWKQIYNITEAKLVTEEILDGTYTRT